METKILSLAQLKGGSGKTTISSHIAGSLTKLGHKVVVIDSDSPQFSMTNWFNVGPEKPNLELAKVQDGNQLIEAVKYYDGKVDFIVIDLAPRLEELTRAGIALSDLTIVPVNTDMVEIWALEPTIELMNEAAEKIPNFQYFVLSNKYQPLDEDHQVMRAGIASQFNCKLLDSTIGIRKAFPSAIGKGLTIGELPRKTPKAINEMNALVNEIITKLELAK